MSTFHQTAKWILKKLARFLVDLLEEPQRYFGCAFKSYAWS